MKYFIFKKGKQAGPFAEGAVRQMIRDGQLSPEDLGIGYGWSEWRKLSEIFPEEMQLIPRPVPSPARIQSARAQRGAASLVVVCGAFLFILAFAGGGLGYFACSNIWPVPTVVEVPDRIGRFKKEKIESAEGSLTGSRKGFVASYVAAEGGARPMRIKYFYNSFAGGVLPMLWDDLRCDGKFERDSRIVSGGRQVGKTAYCTGERSFLVMSFDNVAVTLAPESNAVYPEVLEEMALSLTPYKEARLEPIN